MFLLGLVESRILAMLSIRHWAARATTIEVYNFTGDRGYLIMRMHFVFYDYEKYWINTVMIIEDITVSVKKNR